MPDAILPTAELLGRLSVEDLPRLGEFSGVVNRRVCDRHPDRRESSEQLALRAIADCLRKSDYAAAELDVVISASVSRTLDNGTHSIAPSMALRLGDAIGARRARHFDVGNACAGMMTGILILDRMIKAGVVSNGLVVSGEHITPVAETAVREITTLRSQQIAALTVGDAGAAVVVDGHGDDDDEIHYIELTTLADGAEQCFGMPSDRSCGIALYTDSNAMHDHRWCLQGLDRLGRFLETTGRTFESEKFDYCIYHQFGEPAMSSLREMTGAYFDVTMPPALDSLREFGNTASTSHFVALYEHLAQGNIAKGSKILMVPMASGIVNGYLSTTISRLEA